SLVVRILKGIARVVTGGITDLNPDRFIVKTGRASIGIRGCDLGFQIEPDSDQVYIVRVPTGKRIRVESIKAGQSGGLREIEESGVMVRIWEDGRMEQFRMTQELLQNLSTITTPGPDALLRQRDEESNESQARKLESSGKRKIKSPSILQPMDGVTAGASSPDTRDRTAPPELMDNDLAMVVTQDRVFQDHALIPPPTQPAPVVRPPRPSAGGSVKPDLNPLPPLPTGSFSGGGLGATYQPGAGAGRDLRELFLYEARSGLLGRTLTSSDFSGKILDRAGNTIGVAPLSLRDLPLTRFGSTTRYERYMENNQIPGLTLANDNLGQFVRQIDRNHPGSRLMWWGYDAASFPGSRLPARSVVTYDVMAVQYPDSIIPAIPPAYQELARTGLKVNTQTGAYSVDLPGGKKMFGRVSDLKFYGQESQGVGGIHRDPSAHDTEIKAVGVAGYKINGSEKPAQTGNLAYRGYAMAVSHTTLSPGIPAVLYASANRAVDTVAGNEGRVTLGLNKSDPGFNTVSVDINAYHDPAVPATSDLELGQPDTGYYVDGNDFAAEYRQPGRDVNMQVQQQGQDWSWGDWNGQMEVDNAGSPDVHDAHGEMVAGRTLDPADFQALVAGGVSYSLHTPTLRPGMASAIYNMGTEVVQLSGTSRLLVQIPGSGMTPNWTGTFNLNNAQGDSLNMHVNTAIISPNGHLNGSPSAYNLTVNSHNYIQSDIQNGGMTGSLVGPGRGPVPVTGAIGEGHFVHHDGSAMNMMYGTDLTP
ncbi:MAG: hypothetical protein V2A34_00735, partial [Lentisphaerota bacterium]